MENTLKGIYKLTRVNEYYGTVALITAIGVTLLESISTASVFLLFFANLLSAAFSFMINDIEDSEDDKLDLHKRFRNPVSSGQVNQHMAWLSSIFIMVSSLAIFYFLGLKTLMYGLLASGLGFAYSYKKIRLKSIPVLDIVSHGIFLGMVFVLTVHSIADSHTYGPITTVYIMASVFLGSVLSDLGNELRDIEVDKKANIKNTALYFGLDGKEKLVSFFTIVNFFCVFTLIIYRLTLVPQIILLILSTIVVAHIKIDDKYSYSNVFEYPHKQKFLVLAGIVISLL